MSNDIPYGETKINLNPKDKPLSDKKLRYLPPKTVPKPEPIPKPGPAKNSSVPIPPPKIPLDKNKVLNNVNSHIKLDDLTDLKSSKTSKNIEELNTRVNKLKSTSDSYNNLKSETDILETAQVELEKLKEGTKKDLEDRLPETKREKIIEKLKTLGLFRDDDTISSSGRDNLKEKIRVNNALKGSKIDEEIKLLEELKKTEGLQGYDKNGKDVSEADVKLKIDKKLQEKKSEKERTRKKHWWEKVFFHNNDKSSDYNTINSDETSGFWKNIKTDLSSTKSSLFISYCLFSIIVFTVSLMTLYNDNAIYQANQSLMKSVKGLYYFGISIIVLFLASLSVSFGEDKDIEQKIASFILLLGGIYLGGFFTYLELTNSFVTSEGPPVEPLSSEENFLVKSGVFVYLIFILCSIYYVLFDKKGGKYSRIFSIIYCIVIVIGFLFIGGGLSYVASNLVSTSTYKENILIPIGLFLYGFGIFLLVFAVLDSITFINESIVTSLNLIINVIESFKIKVLIAVMFFMVIYYSLSFYKVYNSKYVKGAGKENDGLNPYLKYSYEIGLILITLLILGLSLSFGGDMKEKVVSFILVLFILFVGGLLTYLDDADKISTTGDESSAVTATVVVYVVLVIACLIYTLFKKRTGDEALTEDIIRVLTNFGGIILFFYMFGIDTAVAFKEFLGKKSGSPEGVSLWSGFGIGCSIIIGSIYLFF